MGNKCRESPGDDNDNGSRDGPTDLVMNGLFISILKGAVNW